MQFLEYLVNLADNIAFLKHWGGIIPTTTHPRWIINSFLNLRVHHIPQYLMIWDLLTLIMLSNLNSNNIMFHYVMFYYMLFSKPALPSGVKEADFCPEESARNTTWKKTYHGHTDKKLCPNGTIGKVLLYVASWQTECFTSISNLP